MLLALLLLVQNPVTVRLNHDRFTPGDHARVYVEAAQDGYLVVLHADADGRVRVLFPLDPSDDDFIRGGKKFELRGRADRDAFQIDANDGSGTVLAAVAPDAFDFAAFTKNDHWDFRALGAPSTNVKDDPLARVLEIVQQMSGDSTGRFEYDYATYVVNSRGIAAGYGYGGGYYPNHIRFGYYDPFCYDPFYWGLSASCYGFGYGFGFRGGWGLGFGFPVYRPYRPYRSYIFTSAPGPKLLIPSRPSRYVPIQPRPRGESGGFSKPNFAPRPNGAGPSRAQPRTFSGGRSGGSRGFGGGGAARPAPRAGGGGGGRRH